MFDFLPWSGKVAHIRFDKIAPEQYKYIKPDDFVSVLGERRLQDWMFQHDSINAKCGSNLPPLTREEGLALFGNTAAFERVISSDLHTGGKLVTSNLLRLTARAVFDPTLGPYIQKEKKGDVNATPEFSSIREGRFRAARPEEEVEVLQFYEAKDIAVMRIEADRIYTTLNYSPSKYYQR